MVVLTDLKALSIKDYSHHCLALFLRSRGSLRRSPFVISIYI
ncbi:hypothetical protein [Nostoc sp. UCD121]|nr:hypothetical protein [Nostoc sp. UCD121]